jgi:hypothetical protein
VPAIGEPRSSARSVVNRRGGMTHPAVAPANTTIDIRFMVCPNGRSGLMVAAMDALPTAHVSPQGVHKLRHDQYALTSTTAWAKACGASCGRLCPMPPVISRCEYLPENLPA